jgi:hypothetical protein
VIISFDSVFNTITFEAENHAEQHQIRDLENRLNDSAAKWNRWDDMHGRTGFTVYVEPDRRKLEGSVR